MHRPLILSTCTREKAKFPSPTPSPITAASLLGGKRNLINDLEQTQRGLLGLPGIQLDPAGPKSYALDLYVLEKNTYSATYPMRGAIRLNMERDSLGADWLFLSGGYGLAHALEPVRAYDASFKRFPGTPCTGEAWGRVLPGILEGLMQNLQPSVIKCFFLDEEYRAYIKATRWYTIRPNDFEFSDDFQGLADYFKRLLGER